MILLVLEILILIPSTRWNLLNNLEEIMSFLLLNLWETMTLK
jgi:hypothetical protein